VPTGATQEYVPAVKNCAWPLGGIGAADIVNVKGVPVPGPGNTVTLSIIISFP
jgi:hypothetical protein